MGEFFGYLINGSLLGLVYAMVAMGFVVTYRASKVFNFAQGELVVLSGFMIWWAGTSFGWSPLASVAFGLAGAAVVGFLIQKIFFEKLVGESAFSMVMVTLALLILIRGFILVLWGPSVRAFPAVFELKAFIIGDVVVPRSLAYGGVVTILCAIALSWFFNKTRRGLALTAVSEDHQVALSLGISVKAAMTLAWIIGSMLSALACVVYLSGKSLNFLASDIGFVALPVALLAGLESIGGLILAGIMVGALQALAELYLNPLLGVDIASIVPYFVILGVLFLKPSGLFGWKTIERV